VTTDLVLLVVLLLVLDAEVPCDRARVDRGLQAQGTA
jgi:hypothetical protein